jgi:DNA-binding PadR family transcriptional regulator
MDFSSDLVRGSVVPIVLALVRERPMYGYEIVKVVHARTNGLLQWKEGTLYPTLHKLEADGLIKSSWDAGPAGKPRKYYAITPRGSRELDQRREQWRRFSGAVDALLTA